MLSTNTANYLELIGNGKSYRVPPFQRDYAWTEQEWEDLWQDIVALHAGEAELHYMGALVIQKASDRDFRVIDGQQRLATLSIMALAIISGLNRMAAAGIDAERNRTRAKELRSRFVGEKDPASLIESSRLNLNETDDGFYQDYLVQGRTPRNPGRLPRSNRLLWQCFKYFSEQIDALDDVQQDGEALAKVLSETTARRLQFIVIAVEDEFSAYTVFETLNARGLELTIADLLKNYLFSKVPVRADRKALERRWQALIATVTTERFSEFLRYHMLCEEPRVRRERLFKMVRSRVVESPQVFALLEVLESRAELFVALSDHTHEYWKDLPEARSCIRELTLFRAKQVTPVLFVAWERFSADDFVRVLRLAVVVSFRYLVSGLNPNPLENAYHGAAKAILDGDVRRPRAVFNRIRRIYVDDSTFRSRFANWSLSPRGQRKRLARYVLYGLEADVAGARRDADTDPGTIEHILPENPSGDWAEGFTGRQLEEAVDRIGNLTLLEADRNRELGSAGYPVKRESYAGSDYALTRQIAEMAPEEWTWARMEERQVRLAQRAVVVWRSDFDDA